MTPEALFISKGARTAVLRLTRLRATQRLQHGVSVWNRKQLSHYERALPCLTFVVF